MAESIIQEFRSSGSAVGDDHGLAASFPHQTLEGVALQGVYVHHVSGRLDDFTRRTFYVQGQRSYELRLRSLDGDASGLRRIEVPALTGDTRVVVGALR